MLAVILLVLAILAAPLVVEAQPAQTVWRIGYISSSSPSPSFVEAFRQGLRELGYIDGKNLVIEWKSGPERLRMLAGELVQQRVALIVATGFPAIRAAREATATIPIVMLGIGDPVAAGLVSTLARPGNNLTGLATITVELSLKHLELLKEAVPGLARVAVFWDPANARAQVAPLESGARSLGVELKTFKVGRLEDFEHAFAAAATERAQGLVVLSSAVFNTHRRSLADLARRNRLAAIYDHRSYVDAGGLMSYGPNFPQMWHRAAVYVDKILKGASAADMPIEQPTTFELVVNLKTAKALALPMPPSLMLRVDHVVE